MDDPVEGVYRLYQAIAFLMEAWDLVKEKPTSARTVDVQLHALLAADIPFNFNRSTRVTLDWTALHEAHLGAGYIADFEAICEETAHTLECLMDLIGRHGGEAQWKVMARAPRQYWQAHAGAVKNDDDAVQDKDAGGLAALHALEACCHSNGVPFVATE